ncbi:hypothetical protein LguiA_027472 [Lonicera macranthoides]
MALICINLQKNHNCSLLPLIPGPTLHSPSHLNLDKPIRNPTVPHLPATTTLTDTSPDFAPHASTNASPSPPLGPSLKSPSPTLTTKSKASLPSSLS